MRVKIIPKIVLEIITITIIITTLTIIIIIITTIITGEEETRKTIKLTETKPKEITKGTVQSVTNMTILLEIATLTQRTLIIKLKK